MIASCAFCGSESLAQKRSGRALFWKIHRCYFRCAECLGFTLIPKLSPMEIDELYSDYYLDGSLIPEALAESGSDNWIRKYRSTIKYLRNQNLDSKNLLDYGCGVDGHGIKVARAMGLTVSGLEISAKTRTILKANTACEIFSLEELHLSPQCFDYILLSDVLEHATEPSLILELVIQHLAENGKIIIQGPLEGTKNFTNLFLNFYSYLTPARVSNFLPYHVSLANKKAIESLLSANALKIEKIRISETWWPAPKSISSIRVLPKVLPQVFAKLLDFTVSFLSPSYGSRFWLVASKSTE